MKRAKPSPELRRAVFTRDGYTCRGCGADDPLTLDVDHIVPVALGGRTTFANLQTLCSACNAAKGAQYPWVSPLMREKLRAAVGLKT